MKRLAFLLACALASCTVGPNYTPPQLPLAPTYRAPQGPPTDTGPWWRIFNDPTLDRLEARALRDNLTIEQALARVDQANAILRQAGAAQKPQVSADGSAARVLQSSNAGLGEFSKLGALASDPTLGPVVKSLEKAAPDLTSRTANDFQLGINTGWDLDFAGGLRRQAEGARANALAAQAGVDAARLSVSAELADAYMQYRGAQAQVTDYRALDALLKEQLTIQRARVRLGAASRSSLDGAIARGEEVAAVIPRLVGLRDAERNRIAVLTGQSPSEDVPELTTPAPIPQAADFGAGLPADLLRYRPDVVVAEEQLIAANAKIGAVMSEYYPKVSLSALLGLHSAALGTLFSAGSGVVQGAAGLHWRLFDFGRVDAEVRQARGTTREALAAYREAVLRASEDVESGFVRLTAVRERATIIARRIKALDDASAIADRAAALGGISRDARLDAQRAVLAAQIDGDGANQDIARAVIAARRAIGH